MIRVEITVNKEPDREAPGDPVYWDLSQPLTPPDPFGPEIPPARPPSVFGPMFTTDRGWR